MKQPFMRAAFILSIASCASCTTKIDAVGETSESIVGGVTDPNDDGAVAIFSETLGLTLCSGALIGPRTVLTAGHCMFDGMNLSVRFGPDSTNPTRTIAVIARAVHPNFTAEGAPYDFGLLELQDAVTDIAPLPLRTTPLTQANVGTLIRHVGYGISNETTGAGLGIKRTVTYPITSVEDVIFYSGAPGEQTCDMDSGAPGFVTEDGVERIAGVVSDGPNCHDAGWDGRADLALLQSFVESTRDAWEYSPYQIAGGCNVGRAGSCTLSETRDSHFTAIFTVLSTLGALTIFRRANRRTRDRTRRPRQLPL